MDRFLRISLNVGTAVRRFPRCVLETNKQTNKQNKQTNKQNNLTLHHSSSIPSQKQSAGRTARHCQQNARELRKVLGVRIENNNNNDDNTFCHLAVIRQSLFFSEQSIPIHSLYTITQCCLDRLLGTLYFFSSWSAVVASFRL